MYSTLGYHAPNDRGDAVYTWDPVDAAADDGGAVIKLSAFPIGRMKLVLNANRWNVRQFGAKGDNAANDNDRDAIRAAVAAAVAHPYVKKVYIPAGKYNMLHGSSTATELPYSILLTKGITLCGDGSDSVLFQPGVLLSPDVDPVDHSVVMLRGDDITVSDLCFIGENGSEDGTGYIRTDHGSYAAIDTWFVFGAPEIYRRVKIERCTFRNLVHFTAHDQGGQIRGGWYRDCVAMWCANGENLCGYDLQHLNNLFYHSEGIEVSGSGTIQGNTLYGTGAVISVTGFVSGPDWRTAQISIIGNQVDQAGIASPGGSGIIVGTTVGVTVTGNTVRNAQAVGIQMANCSRATISDNSILRDISDGVIFPASGIFLSGCTDSNVRGNTIDGGDFFTFGIEGIGLDRCVISGNSVNRASRGYFLANSANLTVTDNTAHQGSPGGLYGADFEACSNVYVDGNTLSGYTVDLRLDPSCSNIRLGDNSYATKEP